MMEVVCLLATSETSKAACAVRAAHPALRSGHVWQRASLGLEGIQ